MPSENRIETSHGLWYNKDTKQLESASGVPIGSFTFELPEWSGPLKWFYFGTHQRWLNPRHYATEETAAAVKAWFEEQFPGFRDKLKVIEDVNLAVTHPRRDIKFPNGAEFSAGLWAYNIATKNTWWAKTMATDELRGAGEL